jgi:DNA-binding CsgD family transcriptional regulator
MGAHLLAAEAAADSAVAWRASGSGRRIAAADGRAALAVRRVPRVSTPAMRAVSARAVLTASEREVCLLTAGGRSNRQVADELCLSVRTVENHLQRAYVKLGINGRTDLAQALNEHLERPPRAHAT